MTAIDTTMPWNSMIKDSADTIEFWGLELQELAMLFMTTRGDTAPSLAYQQREQEDKAHGKGKGKKQPHSRMFKGRYTTNQQGNDICYNYFLLVSIRCQLQIQLPCTDTNVYVVMLSLMSKYNVNVTWMVKHAHHI